jgi:hypothetical protein
VCPRNSVRPASRFVNGCEGTERFLCNRFLYDKCPFEIPLLNCKAPRRVAASRKDDSTISALVLQMDLGYKRLLSFHQTEMFRDGQEIKTSDVDTGRCAHLESRRQKEDTSDKHCPIPETNRGGYSAKGVQPWGLPRFSSVIRVQFGHRVKPRV